MTLSHASAEVLRGVRPKAASSSVVSLVLDSIIGAGEGEVDRTRCRLCTPVQSAVPVEPGARIEPQTNRRNRAGDRRLAASGERRSPKSCLEVSGMTLEECLRSMPGPVRHQQHDCGHRP